MKRWLDLSAVETSPPVPHADGTCSWLLQEPSFLEWASGEKCSVLWIQGHQGCGKSVMAGYLREQLVAKGSSTLFYRFERSASTAQSTPTSFASSLISQLLRSARLSPDNGAFHHLDDLATLYPLGPQHCSFKTVWDVAACLLKMCESTFHLIIDALDECLFDGPALPGKSAFLVALSVPMRETQSKVVIFTRPDSVFVAAMQSGPSVFMAEDLLLPDVMRFARKEYTQLELPDSEQDRVLELVSSSCHGSFRWTEMYLHHLSQTLHPAEFQARMRTIPPPLTEFYRQLLLNGAQRFSQDKLECRKTLLLAIFQAQRPLRTAEVADAFSLRRDRADVAISELCKPLASTFGGFFHLSHPSVREFFELCHRAGDGSFGISFSDSHGLLAEACLSCLLRERYADLRRIGSYLMANYEENASVEPDAQPCEGSFYDYASRFWDFHLVRAKSPSKELLQLANRFILSLQLAYWSERSRQDCGQLVRVNVALGSLAPWHKGLSRQDRALFKLDEYFTQAYSRLSTEFASGAMDTVLPWLARMTMGDFYFIRCLPDEVIRIREQVLAGLRDCLGSKHDLTLSAQSGAAYGRLYEGKMRAARRMYNEVHEIRRKARGQHSAHFLETLQKMGQSEYYMGDFVGAVVTWTKALADCLGHLGPDNWQTLTVQWLYALAVTNMDQLELGLCILQSVVQKRHKLFGLGDTFAKVVMGTIGEVQLLLGQHEESIATIQNAVAWRRQIYPPSHLIRLDVEILLAIAYYAGGMREAAQAVLQEVEGVADNSHSSFERYCQVVHLKGLLLAEEGLTDEAICLLQNTVTQAEEDQHNRALLWILLDLATLLRRRDREGDRDQASANFDKIVKDVSGDCEPGFPDEPDPPRLLAVAEKVLRLVRSRKHAEARRELDSEQLDWRRPSDLWLWVGGMYIKDLLQIRDFAAGSD